MTSAAVASEALERARSSQSVANYVAIIQGFTARGIPESDILPRENVLTFHAWRAVGRVVRKGEHGVSVLTWIPLPDRVDNETGKVKRGGMRPKRAVVFHVSQTESLHPTIGEIEAVHASTFAPADGLSRDD